jgi:hypothetical protein
LGEVTEQSTFFESFYLKVQNCPRGLTRYDLRKEIAGSQCNWLILVDFEFDLLELRRNELLHAETCIGVKPLVEAFV